MQHVAHARRVRLRQEGKPQIARRLVVVQLVLAGAEADEGVVVAAELAGHVAQGEDGTEDQFGVIVGLLDHVVGGLLRGWRGQLVGGR